MAAPSGTTWGSIVGSYGRIGIYTSTSSTNTQTTVTIQVWFWSKYSVLDTSNTLYYSNQGSSTAAYENLGFRTIDTTEDSGSGWSTSNQVCIYSTTATYTRTAKATTRYIHAKFADVDRVGGTMYASKTVTIPKLSTYTISYNANGGSGAPSSQTKTYGVPLMLSSSKPTRTGYSFQGWATSSTGSVAYAAGASYTANSAATLYAVWKANTYTVSYNANGGSGAPSSQTKTYGVTLTLSTTKPTRTNYTFKGWGTSSVSTTVSYAPGASYTSNASITLYAIWELAYVKPRITDLTVTRCTSDGTANDEGSYALVSFNWECDQSLSEIQIEWKSASGDSSFDTVSASGTSGSVSQIVGGALSTETTYSITVVVTDAVDSTYAFATLNGSKFAIDFLAGGRGAAFNKPAELEDVLDIGFKTRHFAGLLPVVLEPETDLNDVRTPNTYTGADISSYNYENCPVDGGTFTLLVESCGEAGQVRQTYVTCSKYMPERYVRFYYQSAWGDWLWAGTEEYVLYENAEGSSGAITLNSYLLYYRYIEIYFTDNNGKSGGYVKVWDPDNGGAGRTICLSLTEASSTTNAYSRQTTYEISMDGMTPVTSTAGYIQFNLPNKTISNSVVGTNHIKIVRVIGRA